MHILQVCRSTHVNRCVYLYACGGGLEVDIENIFSIVLVPYSFREGLFI